MNESAANVTLYPNPARDSFTVEAEQMRSVEVYNMVGQVIYKSACEGDIAVIELGNVEAGIYMVKVVTVSGEHVQKVSVIR